MTDQDWILRHVATNADREVPFSELRKLDPFNRFIVSNCQTQIEAVIVKYKAWIQYVPSPSLGEWTKYGSLKWIAGDEKANEILDVYNNS